MQLLDLGRGKQRSSVMVERRRYVPELSQTLVTCSTVINYLNPVQADRENADS